MGQENTVPRRINGVEGAAGQVMISGGPGVCETWGAAGGAPTKEFFVPITSVYDSSAWSALESHGDYATNGDYAASGFRVHASFKVPHDFTSIISAEFIVIPTVSQAAADWDIYSDYAAEGESYNTNSESDTTSTYNVVNNIIFAVDISGILSSLAADDYVGVRMTMGSSNHKFRALGIRFKYS